VIFRAMSDLEITYPAGLQKLDEYMDAVSSRMNLGGITRQTHLEIISQ
jgi:saccharopine dehydrogenase-like NADP-dependent oxidoreductase